jgi:hypothetical protein
MGKEEIKKVHIRALLFAVLFFVLAIGFYAILAVLGKVELYWYFIFPLLLVIFGIILPIVLFIQAKYSHKKHK